MEDVYPIEGTFEPLTLLADKFQTNVTAPPTTSMVVFSHQFSRTMVQTFNILGFLEMDHTSNSSELSSSKQGRNDGEQDGLFSFDLGGICWCNNYRHKDII